MLNCQGNSYYSHTFLCSLRSCSTSHTSIHITQSKYSCNFSNSGWMNKRISLDYSTTRELFVICMVGVHGGLILQAICCLGHPISIIYILIIWKIVITGFIFTNHYIPFVFRFKLSVAHLITQKSPRAVAVPLRTLSSLQSVNVYHSLSKALSSEGDPYGWTSSRVNSKSGLVL